MLTGHEGWVTRDYGRDGKAVTMSRTRLGDFVWWVLHYEGQITSCYAMNPAYPRSYCQFAITLPAGKKEAFERDSGFTLEKPPVLVPA
jgi:hypothetical protein